MSKANKMKEFEQTYESKKAPEFKVGDTLKVHVRVKEGDKTRVQLFEGTCTRKKGRGANATFAVLKESYGDMVEKIFPVHSPSIEKIAVSQKGKARRAKLYHLSKKK
jgi:large subunit ribosomal protein L19